jgi:hypothetical protein
MEVIFFIISKCIISTEWRVALQGTLLNSHVASRSTNQHCPFAENLLSATSLKSGDVRKLSQLITATSNTMVQPNFRQQRVKFHVCVCGMLYRAGITRTRCANRRDSCIECHVTISVDVPCTAYMRC